MTWPLRRTLARKLFGIRRRSRSLRHALETYAGEAARSQATARTEEDAAHHAGRRVAYLNALGQMSGLPPAAPAEPPTKPALARAWRRGHDLAADHAQRLLDEML